MLLNLLNISHISFTFILLNVRSLNKHSIDISCDKRLRETDILCLTETQISLGQNTKRLEEYLPEFCFFHNKSKDKNESLAFCARDSPEIDILSQSPGISSFLACKGLMSFSLKILLLYRKNSGNLALLYQEFVEINAGNTFNIILSDFNINFLEQNSQISQLLSDYVQIVFEPNQISGSLLDHVYIQRNILDTMDVKS